MREAHQQGEKRRKRSKSTAVEASEFKTDELIEEVFLRTVSRPPSQKELENARADIANADDPIDGLRDLLWAMLNTREFMVNH